MIKKKLKIKNKLGLHARASNKLSELANNFNSQTFITFNDERVDAKSMMDILLLSIAQNDEFQIEISGDDENDSFKAINNLIDNLFDEGE
ncbi:MAG: HPr family phosphocarrier protein [Nitrosomonadales bacterium]|jgi:phosphocarrier protein HPr